MIASHQEFTNILSHQNIMDIGLHGPQKSDSSSFSLLNETLSYLKTTNRPFTDDFSLLEVPCMDDCHPETTPNPINNSSVPLASSINIYDTKIKLPDLDEIMNESGLLNSEMKILGSRNTSKLPLPNFSDMKILGPKYQEFEAASQYHDIKIFNGYDQFLRSTPVNGYRPGGKKFEDLQQQQQQQQQEDILVKVDNRDVLVPVSSFWDEWYLDTNDNDFAYPVAINPNV